MMSPEAIDRIRKMTPSERLRMTLQMIQESTPYLFVGDPDMVARRFELLHRENDARNNNMRQALARTKRVR
jgi:hypothetical protein